MLLPMIGFTFMLMVVGGLACIIVTGMQKPTPLASRIGFAIFFSGLGAFAFSMALSWLEEALFDLAGAASMPGFFGGYILGGSGGAVIGWKMGSHISQQ